MMRPTRQLLIGLLSLLAIVPFPQRAWAQYPAHDKRITFVVPFSAGGSNDILARVIAQTLSDSWHIPVTIINQVGASGSLGAARVAKAEPDGC